MTTRHPTRGFQDGETTPTPQACVTAEEAARIAEDKAGLAVAAHVDNCKRLDELKERVGEMERTQKAHSDLWAQQKGAQRVILWVVPLLTTTAVSIAVALLNHFVRR